MPGLLSVTEKPVQPAPVVEPTPVTWDHVEANGVASNGGEPKGLQGVGFDPWRMGAGLLESGRKAWGAAKKWSDQTGDWMKSHPSLLDRTAGAVNDQFVKPVVEDFKKDPREAIGHLLPNPARDIQAGSGLLAQGQRQHSWEDIVNGVAIAGMGGMALPSDVHMPMSWKRFEHGELLPTHPAEAHGVFLNPNKVVGGYYGSDGLVESGVKRKYTAEINPESNIYETKHTIDNTNAISRVGLTAYPSTYVLLDLFGEQELSRLAQLPARELIREADAMHPVAGFNSMLTQPPGKWSLQSEVFDALAGLELRDRGFEGYYHGGSPNRQDHVQLLRGETPAIDYDAALRRLAEEETNPDTEFVGLTPDVFSKYSETPESIDGKNVKSRLSLVNTLDGLEEVPFAKEVDAFGNPEIGGEVVGSENLHEASVQAQKNAAKAINSGTVLGTDGTLWVLDQNGQVWYQLGDDYGDGPTLHFSDGKFYYYKSSEDKWVDSFAKLDPDLDKLDEGMIEAAAHTDFHFTDTSILETPHGKKALAAVLAKKDAEGLNHGSVEAGIAAFKAQWKKTAEESK